MRRQPVSPLPTSVRKVLHLLRESALCYQQTDRTAEAKAGAQRVLTANPKFTIGNWRRTQFRNDVAQLEADVAALQQAGLPE
jgi:hypothetical protein